MNSKMAKAWNQTRVSEALGIEYPIIQGPQGGLRAILLARAKAKEEAIAQDGQ